MEKNDIKLLISGKNIIRDKHIPTPPTPEGVWKDEARDHDFFQRKVSLAAQLGGVHSSAGCMTSDAEIARQAAEQQYYRSQEIHPKKILEKKRIR